MNNLIVLLAAGKSERFKNKNQIENKLLFKIDTLTIFEICLINIKKMNLNFKVLPVLQNIKNKELLNICKKHDTLMPVEGGNTRQESVLNALNKLKNYKLKNIFIHDAARPFISIEVVNNLIKNISKNISGVIPCLQITDSLRNKTLNVNNKINRSNYLLIQTPQLFNFNHLLKSHLKTKKLFEDDSALLVDNGYKIKTILGDRRSIKITHFEDIYFLKPYIEKNMNEFVIKVGTGYDVHKLVKKNKENINKVFKLGGLEVDLNYFLHGHSDADVLLHSLTDSIYGAMNYLDIGQHFPPTDKKYKDFDSFVFLNHALDELKKREGTLVHIDITVITEIPKISTYSNKIKETISKSTGIKKEVISIKGKTNEGIGFLGRKEGIAVISTTTIKIKNTLN